MLPSSSFSLIALNNPINCCCLSLFIIDPTLHASVNYSWMTRRLFGILNCILFQQRRFTILSAAAMSAINGTDGIALRSSFIGTKKIVKQNWKSYSNANIEGTQSSSGHSESGIIQLIDPLKCQHGKLPESIFSIHSRTTARAPQMTKGLSVTVPLLIH